LAVLRGVVPVKIIAAEARRIDGELGFKGLERERALGNQALEERRDVLALQQVENAVEVRGASDETLRGRIAQVGHEAATGNGAVNLEAGGKQLVVQRQGRTAALLFRTGHVGYQIAEQ